jgi:hypothetical protein
VSDQPRTQAELERTFRNFADPEYSDGLEQGDGTGFDPVAAAAQVHARASAAIARNGQAFYVLPHSLQTGPSASGAVLASGPVTVARTRSAQLELRIPPGKALLGRLLGATGLLEPLPTFVLRDEVVLAAGELGPVTVTAEATRPGDQANLLAGTLIGFAAEGVRRVACTTAGDGRLVDTGMPDVFTASDVGRYLRLSSDAVPVRVLSYGQSGGIGTVGLEGTPPGAGSYTAELLEWADLSVVVTQPEDFTNGRHATLDAIGRESDISRGPGESDLDYAYRISAQPDVVSPNAIARIAARILSPIGVDFEIHEAFADLPGFTLDISPLDAGSTCAGGRFDGHQLLSEETSHRYFVICIGANPNAGATGLPFDAVNAGVNSFDSAEGPGDGSATLYDNAITTLRDALVQAHGAGVGFRLLKKSVYRPWELVLVDVEVDLVATTPEYVAAATLGLEGFFQEWPVETSAAEWQVVQAIEQGLIQAGLDPTVLLTSVGALLAGPRQALRLGVLTVT